MLSPGHRSLPRGYRLDRYEFDRVLGTPGAFGITYAARAPRVGWVAIKELFPIDHVVRRGEQTVVAQTAQDQKMFRAAMDLFRREVKVLSKISHPNVVRVIDYLEANGTGYMVMIYARGYDLDRYIKGQRPGRLNENELLKILMPLLDGLQAVHDLDYLHRDIKPSNLYLSRDDHVPLLLDFGAAHQMVVSRSRPITQILTPPYAPIEQWGHELPLGPFSDIHAMGVVLYEAMMGDHRFPNAPDRLGKDPLVPLVRQLRGQEYSKDFLTAVDWALQLQASDRPQKIEDWRRAFLKKGSRRITDNQDRERSRHLISTGLLKICALVLGVALTTAVLVILGLALSGALQS